MFHEGKWLLTGKVCATRRFTFGLPLPRAAPRRQDIDQITKVWEKVLAGRWGKGAGGRLQKEGVFSLFTVKSMSTFGGNTMNGPTVVSSYLTDVCAHAT